VGVRAGGVGERGRGAETATVQSSSVAMPDYPSSKLKTNGAAGGAGGAGPLSSGSTVPPPRERVVSATRSLQPKMQLQSLELPTTPPKQAPKQPQPQPPSPQQQLPQPQQQPQPSPGPQHQQGGDASSSLQSSQQLQAEQQQQQQQLQYNPANFSQQPQPRQQQLQQTEPITANAPQLHPQQPQQQRLFPGRRVDKLVGPVRPVLPPEDPQGLQGGSWDGDRCVGGGHERDM